MHEMSIALAVVGQVEEAAPEAGSTVSRVELQVGELAGVVPDALGFCFELACAGTLLEGAELVVRSVPARARCGACAGDWAVGLPPELCCPRCGSATEVELLSGRELRILTVTWEDARSTEGATVAAPCLAPISEEA
ncbi:hydrogenase maturation nickel metallochaperone HypA [Streptomyces sp. NBC_01264]|uniref:hydrogenase maturation nickel metallochaperone HypA/HybF n=1 Tax=Streptomyces sp. NBC_01264 TaxID=2903804 RepID=UPI00224FF924|nr:hydrogenase maturation nickel metallochaperone HypA [Streptomyces sp. NBC_01264]MCX4775922.1 hydrogenase maturation nickel metallochaperone HypA [Streptomyces sp. NBC_01264]